jgi:protein-L-isoaspartate(D-aspartate) O-methyltransferase
MLSDIDPDVTTAAFILGLRQRGIRDTALLRALEKTPRAVFAPMRLRAWSHNDMMLPLPCGQVMLAPSVVADMLAKLEVQPTHRVLEIGTGSGYVTAVLARLARQVVSIERFRTLSDAAAERLAQMLTPEETAPALIWNDGWQALSGAMGAFDRILVNGRMPEVPHALLAHLADNGRLVGTLDTESVFIWERDESGTLCETKYPWARARHIPPLLSGVSKRL